MPFIENDILHVLSISDVLSDKNRDFILSLYFHFYILLVYGASLTASSGLLLKTIINIKIELTVTGSK